MTEMDLPVFVDASRRDGGRDGVGVHLRFTGPGNASVDVELVDEGEARRGEVRFPEPGPWRANVTIAPANVSTEYQLPVYPHGPYVWESPNVTATFTIAGETYTPEIRGQHGRDGWYTAEIIPTREGVYQVHVTGEIEGTPVDVTVDLQSVDSTATIMFPEEDLTPEETTRNIADLETEIAALRAELDEASMQGDSDGNETPAPAVTLTALALVGAALVVARRARP